MSSLTSEQIRFLAEPRFAVAATMSRDGLPHQTVVWYALDDEGERAVVSTPSGSLKHRHLLRDPRLSLCVEDGFRFVTMSGRVEIEEEPGAARELYGRIGARYLGALAGASAGPPAGAPGGAAPFQPDPKTAELLSRERVTLRMTIERVRTNGFG